MSSWAGAGSIPVDHCVRIPVQNGDPASTAGIERSQPEQVEALLEPLFAFLGDRLIRADMISLVGDAYFEAGRFREARVRYRASLEAFSLPRFVNPHAQEAMLGL